MKSPSIPLSLIGLAFIFLIVAGLRPQSLPFIPDARFSDAAISHWPAALHLRETVLQQGGFPYWQEAILAGGPFAANPLNKTAYPLQWLAVLLPPVLHINLLITLHLLLAGWGMWRWARALELPEAAAGFSALAYAFAPKVLAHVGAGHVDLLYALAWWPWLMLAVYNLLSAPRTTWRSIAQTSILAALLVLADVRLSLFALLLAACYGVWVALQQPSPDGEQPRWQKLLRGIPVLPIFALLTLSVTIPLLAWQPYLSRSDMTAADAATFSLEAGHLVGLLLPPHSGNVETIAYLSLPVLLLAGIAVFAAPRKQLFWLIALFIAVFYALGSNSFLWPLLVDVLPFLRWFRVPARAWFVVVLVASLLAGYGLQTLMRTVERLRQGEAIRRLVIKRLAIAGWMGGSLFCGGFTLVALAELPAAIGLGVLVIGLLLGVTLLLGFYGRLTAHRLALLLTLVLFVDLAWTGYHWLAWRGPEAWLTHQDTLVEILEAEAPARIYSPNYVLEQQAAAAHDLWLFYGVDPFQLTGVVEAIEQGSGVPVAAYSVTLPPMDLDADPADERSVDERLLTANQDVVPDTQTLAAWGVSHVLTTYPIADNRLELRANVDGYFVYANLDYEPVTLNAWGWPVDWPNLPDAATIASLNQQTLAAAVVAAISFLMTLAFVLWGIVRR